MKITKNQVRQLIKEELAAVLNESPRPSLFGQPSTYASDAASRMGAIHSAPSSTPDFASDIASMPMPDSKMIKIEKVFNAEGDALDPSMGANITAHTIRLLAAAIGDSSLAGAVERGTPIDVTVDMDGKAIGAQVAQKILPQSTLEEQGAYGDAVGQKGGHGGDSNLHKIKSTLTRSDTQGGGSRATTNTSDIGADSTLTQRRAQDTGTGRSSADAKSVRSDGSTSSQEERYAGDTSYVANTRVPVGGSKAKPSRKDPLGLGTKPGAHSSETLTVGGVELKPGDEGYFDAFEKVGMPGLPEAGETGEERNFVKTADVSALDNLEETFKRWKKLIK